MKLHRLAPLACAVAIAAPAHAALQFTDWTTINTTTDVAVGTVGTIGVTLSGTVLNGGVTNGTATFFSGPSFTPSLAQSDVVEFGAASATTTFVVTFSQPVVNPVFHLADLSSLLTFTATPVSLSGLTTSGNTIGCNGAQPSCRGTISFAGTFASLGFSAFNSAGNEGIYIHVGFDPLLAVPEPTSLALLLAGLGAVALRSVRRAR